MINYHLLLGRRHGKADAEPLLVGFTEDTSALTRKYEELTGPGVAAFAEEFAEVLWISNGIVLANHDFPDPSEVAKAEKAKKLAEAVKVQAAADKAKADLDAAKDRAAATASAVRQLTQEQKALLADAAAAKAKADADAKAKADADAKSAADERAAAEQRAADTKAAADRAAARDTFIAELAGQTDEQLAAQCLAAKLDVLANEPRDIHIAALVKSAGFDS